MFFGHPFKIICCIVICLFCIPAGFALNTNDIQKHDLNFGHAKTSDKNNRILNYNSHTDVSASADIPPEMKNNSRIAFITAIIGKYEKSIKYYPEQTIPADFIIFTDSSHHFPSDSHKWIVDKTPYHLLYPSKLDDGTYHNSLSRNNHTFNIAKYYKQAFQNIPRLRQYDVVVWLDGSIQIKAPTAADYLLRQALQYNMVSTESTRIGTKLLISEVKVSDGANGIHSKYHSHFWFNQSQPWQNVTAQYEAYIADGYTDTDAYWEAHNPYNHNGAIGLWTTCIIAFDNHNANVTAFLDLWYLQTLNYTTQDQISFPYVVQKTGMDVLTLPGYGVTGYTLDNSLFKLLSHSARK